MYEKSIKTANIPELLSPAGDMECLIAAVAGGADAVYFGASAFNARARAQNFGKDDLRAAVEYCHDYGRKAYVTLNTALRERELSDALALAAEIYEAGADAVICADIGLISELRRQIPGLEVHISTQAGVRSIAGAKAFAEMGAARVVLARELTKKEMTDISRECGVETEVFVHGALCVSVSGRCLFSSLVGGRSGNRGECAQPCRLPYNKGKYLLSLKDMSLAPRLTELCETGCASLKIEGRLKSPDYVYGVTKIYRSLLDDVRNATPEESRKLEKIFSRSGFTDGYFTGKITPAMNGIRGDEPEKAEPPVIEEPKISVKLFASVKRGENIRVKFERADGRMAEAVGTVPEEAQNRPMTKDDIKKPLSALGGTPFILSECEIDADEGLMVPLSSLKALRRAAIEMLRAESHPKREAVKTAYTEQKNGDRKKIKSAKFYDASALTQKAKDFFDTVFIPAEEFSPEMANGAFLPETASEGDTENLQRLLRTLKGKGCKKIMVSDIGELYEAASVGFDEIHTDIGFNVYNSASVKHLEELGATRILASAELNLPAAKALFCGITVYGRIPLMILKKCIGKELIGCDKCKKSNGAFTLTDRKGISFPGIRDKGFFGTNHGSIIFNSLPTYMGDKLRGDRAVSDVHFIFTTESKNDVDEVIKAYENGASLGVTVRRI